MPISFDIEVPRQGDWVKELHLTDIDGDALNITGHSFSWQARAIAGAGSVLASATVTILEALTGVISVRWHGPDFDAVEGATEITRVAHDLKDTYPDGTIDVVARGHLILFPEVTA